MMQQLVGCGGLNVQFDTFTLLEQHFDVQEFQQFRAFNDVEPRRKCSANCFCFKPALYGDGISNQLQHVLSRH